MKRQPKRLTASLRAHVMPEEKLLLEEKSEACGLTLSQWTRQRLLEAAHFSPDLLRVLQKMCTAKQLFDSGAERIRAKALTNWKENSFD